MNPEKPKEETLLEKDFHEKIKQDRIFAERTKAEIFVEHVESHLEAYSEVDKLPRKVICKICNQTIDEIYEQKLKEVKKDEAL